MRRPDGLPDDLDGRFDNDEDTAALLDEADTAPMRYSYGQDLPTWTRTVCIGVTR